MKRDVTFYEKDIAKRGMDYSRGFYEDRNCEFARMIHRHSPKKVIEFAAAEGNLAFHILLRCDIETYLVTDFSPTALHMAREAVGLDPRTSFRLMDADKEYKAITNFDYDTFVCTALEHLENDLAILTTLRRGTLICICLPNFIVDGHIRAFRSETEIRERYGHLMEILQIRQVDLNHNANAFFIKVREWIFRNRFTGIISKITNGLGVEVIGNRKKWLIIGERK
jgi:hypothetical protein